MAQYNVNCDMGRELVEREHPQLVQTVDIPVVMSDTYQYSEKLVHDACVALHGIIAQDIKRGKEELLKDAKFIQGRLYEIVTYLMDQQTNVSSNKVILEYEHPSLRYLIGETNVCPKIDLLVSKTKPREMPITSIMLRKSSRGYEPDKRSMRLDMTRLAYLILERRCKWSFYIWIGTAEKLHWMDMSKHVPLEMKNREVVLSRDARLLPRAKPIPGSFTKSMLVNRYSTEFCLRVYRIEPEMTPFDDDDDDMDRLKQFYSGYKIKAPGCGTLDVSDQLKDIRKQLLKVRDYIEAGLIDHAKAMLLLSKVLFVDMVTVKKLSSKEIDESDYLKEHLSYLREMIDNTIWADEQEESNEL
ncbi:uncharacterized protein LOC144360115 [Saccoglossus kowalevskii]